MTKAQSKAKANKTLKVQASPTIVEIYLQDRPQNKMHLFLKIFYKMIYKYNYLKNVQSIINDDWLYFIMEAVNSIIKSRHRNVPELIPIISEQFGIIISIS